MWSKANNWKLGNTSNITWKWTVYFFDSVFLYFLLMIRLHANFRQNMDILKYQKNLIPVYFTTISVSILANRCPFGSFIFFCHLTPSYSAFSKSNRNYVILWRWKLWCFYRDIDIKHQQIFLFKNTPLKPLSTNPTNWSNTLK